MYTRNRSFLTATEFLQNISLKVQGTGFKLQATTHKLQGNFILNGVRAAYRQLQTN
jgi:hypothetical protein